MHDMLTLFCKFNHVWCSYSKIYIQMLHHQVFAAISMGESASCHWHMGSNSPSVLCSLFMRSYVAHVCVFLVLNRSGKFPRAQRQVWITTWKQGSTGSLLLEHFLPHVQTVRPRRGFESHLSHICCPSFPTPLLVNTTNNTQNAQLKAAWPQFQTTRWHFQSQTEANFAAS